MLPRTKRSPAIKALPTTNIELVLFRFIFMDLLCLLLSDVLVLLEVSSCERRICPLHCHYMLAVCEGLLYSLLLLRDPWSTNVQCSHFRWFLTFLGLIEGSAFLYVRNINNQDLLVYIGFSQLVTWIVDKTLGVLQYLGKSQPDLTDTFSVWLFQTISTTWISDLPQLI